MPKFYCIHCGQHIDAPDEMTGHSSLCPTCGGKIDVPMPAPEPLAPVLLPQTVIPVKEDKRAKSKFLSSRSLKASIGAGAIWFVWCLIRPSNVMEQRGLSDRDVITIFGETLGGLFSISLIAVIIALVIAGIMTAFKKRFTSTLSRAYSIGVLVVAGLVLLANLVFNSNRSTYSDNSNPSERENAHNAISGLENDVRSIIEEGFDSDGMPRKSDLTLNSNTPATDDMQRMRQLIQSFFNDMISLQNEYLQALEDDELDTLLDANRVAEDTDFKDSRLILARVKLTASKTQSKARQILADFPERMKNYEFSSKSNQKALEGYQEGLDKALPLFREMWDLEVEVIDQMEDLINHLEKTRAHWEPVQGKFTFDRNSDLEQFNAIIKKITDCSERQSEIRESSQKSAMDKLDSIKNRIPK